MVHYLVVPQHQGDQVQDLPVVDQGYLAPYQDSSTQPCHLGDLHLGCLQQQYLLEAQCIQVPCSLECDHQ